MCGNVLLTSPLANGRPPRPRPTHRDRTSSCRRPRRRHPSALRTSPGLGQRAHVHERPDRHQRERRHRPEGIFARRLAAATYGGSGFGGGATAGAAAALRPTGPDGAAAAGVASVVAGVAAGAASEAPSVLAAASPPPSPNAARRSRERLSRCSGISVIVKPVGDASDEAPWPPRRATERQRERSATACVAGECRADLRGRGTQLSVMADQTIRAIAWPRGNPVSRASKPLGWRAHPTRVCPRRVRSAERHPDPMIAIDPLNGQG